MSRYGSYVSDTLLQMEHFTKSGGEKTETKRGCWVYINRMITDYCSVKHRPLFHFLSTAGKPQATSLNNTSQAAAKHTFSPFLFFLCVLRIDTSRPEVTSEDLVNQRRGLGLPVEPEGAGRKKDS